MRRLTPNDLEALRELWQHPRLRRASLASWTQRACDRLASAGILQTEQGLDDLSGRGHLGGGNGQHLIYVYDPRRAHAAGDINILRQIALEAPELLAPRPVGKVAQRTFRLLPSRPGLAELACPSCGASYRAELPKFEPGTVGGVYTCWSCGHKWGIRRHSEENHAE